MLLIRNAFVLVQKSPRGHVTAQKCHFLGTKKPLRACHCSEMPFLGTKKAPAGMLLLRNASLWVQKKPLRACYCSDMLFVRYEKAAAGMSLLRNYIFEVKKTTCGHVTAQKLYPPTLRSRVNGVC